MEILREMVQVLTKYKTKQIEVLGNPTDNPSQVYEFYEAIAAGTFTTDEEAAAHFFDGNPRNQSYKNLKSRLKNRLINTVFFVEANQSMFNDLNIANINCYKEWASAKILINRNAKRSGINICLKVLKQAKKAEIMEIIEAIAKDLRNYYGTRKYDKKKFEEYNALVNESILIRQKELKAEEYYLRMTQHYMRGKPSQADLLADVTQYSKLLRDDIQKYPTIRMLFFGGLVEVAKLMCINDYKATIKFCKEILSKLLIKPVVFKNGIASFSFQMMVCFIQLKEFDEGKQIFEQVKKYIVPASFNWYKGYELYMYLLFYTSEYQLAYETYKLVAKTKLFSQLPAYVKETWLIFKGYLHFLKEIDLIQIKTNDKEFLKFRLGKFINEVPQYTQDKRGANISILVIEILFTILQKNYNRAIDRIEAIEKYTSRYLKKDDNFRSNCFIKMLLEISKGGFHRIAVERNANKYRKRLDEMPLEKAKQAHSIEIIPYEDLWELILNSLGTKRHKSS